VRHPLRPRFAESGGIDPISVNPSSVVRTIALAREAQAAVPKPA
jgi:hypothetical protein